MIVNHSTATATEKGKIINLCLLLITVLQSYNNSHLLFFIGTNNLFFKPNQYITIKRDRGLDNYCDT